MGSRAKISFLSAIARRSWLGTMPVEGERPVSSPASPPGAPVAAPGVPVGSTKSRSAFSEGIGMVGGSRSGGSLRDRLGQAPLPARAAQEEEGDAQVEQVPGDAVEERRVVRAGQVEHLAG